MAEEKKAPLIAYWSEKAAKVQELTGGLVQWRLADGSVVEVTEVSRNGPGADDAVELGEAVECVLGRKRPGYVEYFVYSSPWIDRRRKE